MNAPATPTSANYRLLDALRGVAALTIVLYHALLQVCDKAPAAADHLPLALRWLRGHGQIGVDLFFVISGYCIAAAAVSTLRRHAPAGGPRVARTFAIARARRIAAPLYASLALFIVAGLAAEHLANRGLADRGHLARLDLSHQGPAYYLAAAALLQPYIGQEPLSLVTWSLSYEVAFYAIVGIALLAVCRRRPDPTALLTACLTLTIACLAAVLVWRGRVPMPLDLWPLFGLGVLAFDVLRTAPARRTVVLAGLIAALTIAVIAGPTFASGWTRSPSTTGFTTALLTAAAIVALRRWDAAISATAPARLLAAVGHVSYSLYLTHFLTIAAASVVLKRTGLFTWPVPVAMLVLAGIAMVAALPFFWVFERPFLTSRRPVSTAAAGVADDRVPVAG